MDEWKQKISRRKELRKQLAARNNESFKQAEKGEEDSFECVGGILFGNIHEVRTQCTDPLSPLFAILYERKSENSQY